MTLPKETKILIVGLGLIGGSYARALTKRGYAVRAITLEQSSVDFAKNAGIVADAAAEIRTDWIRDADHIVFALYPHIFVEWIEEHGHLLTPGTVVTDVTGIKCAIIDRIQSMIPDGVEFIAAHPMAGREVYGVENSDDGIFRGANYIVTPTERNTPDAIALCRSLGETLGFARVSELTPEKHDEMIAFLSQLTHCIAVALMTSNTEPHLVDYTGDSFRDLTRIARINEDMWSELFLLNKDELLAQMDLFASEFNELRNLLAEGDAEGMKEKMRLSTTRRAWFDK